MVQESLPLVLPYLGYLFKKFPIQSNTQANLEIANQHQKANPRATFGVTKFMDLSQDEFAKYYLNK